MKRPELDSFEKIKIGSLKDVVKYCLQNDITLGYPELNLIFNNIVYKNARDKYLNPNYKKLFDAVKYLMNNLNGKAHRLLIDVINKYFEFEIEYNVNSDIFSSNFLMDEFAGYSFECIDLETANYLINLANKLQTKQYVEELDDFKQTTQNL